MKLIDLKHVGTVILVFGVLAGLAGAGESGADEGWQTLFNGKDFDGWEFRGGGDEPPTFDVEDGTIVGRTRIPRNNSAFLCTKKQFTDFELVFDVKIDEGLNSGVQVRSTPEGTMRRAQVEIESGSPRTGYIFGQGMGTWLSEDLPKNNETYNANQWNTFRVLACGDNIKTWINGKPVADTTSDRIAPEGVIALQVHGYPRGKNREQGSDKVLSVAWKNIKIREVSTSRSKAKKPNIVLFYIDDWAWNGSPVAMDDSMENSFMPVLEMPNVERLAKEGMKFRNAYGSPQCSPARACIQTGQSSPRNGLTVYLNSPEPYYDTSKEYQSFPLVPNVADRELDEEAVTIAEALKPLGYVSAHIGKWHMRSDPGRHGYVLHDGDTTNDPGNTLKKGLKPGEPQPKRLPKDMSDPKLMFSVTKKAIGFMEDQVDQGNPFYLQISHYAMHAGRECLNETREKYLQHPLVKAWYKENNKDPETINRKDDPAIWLGMGEDLDGRIGAVLEKAKVLGIADNTYFIVVADNGYRHEELLLKPGLKQPLHARKWWLWDGGIRVPMIVKGPGIKAGSVFSGNVVNYDFLPTFVDWAGGDPDKLQNIDGVSLAGYMAGQKPDEAFLNRNLYFHYPHYRDSVPHSVMISGSSKVVQFYHEPTIPMLFDLSKDMGEVRNIAKENPEIHQKLYGEMMRYLKEVGARFPKVNPNYDLEEYKKDRKTQTRLKWGPFEGERPLDEDEI